MSHVLAERDGWMFIKETDTDYAEPRSITWWWPTGIRFSNFALWFATPELAREALGKLIHPTSDVSYQDERGIRWVLQDGGKTKPAYTDIMALPEPKQRGKKLPLEWKRGQWYKQTTRGWVLA